MTNRDLLLQEATRANVAEALVDLYKDALRAAAEAFAQYALDTNEPPAEAVEVFIDGFMQEANLRRVIVQRRGDGQEMANVQGDSA